MGILAPEMRRRPCEKSASVLKNWMPGSLKLSIWGLCLVLLWANPSGSFGQTVSREYALKAVFLLNFSRFTEWPTNTFETPKSDFVIGILGKSPFGTSIEEAVQGERLNQHKYVVESYRDVTEIKNCEMLFISRSETSHLREIVARLGRKPVLTVSDIQNAADAGVCVEFVIENDKIRLRINLDSLKSAHLVMSSELLRLTTVVSGPPK